MARVKKEVPIEEMEDENLSDSIDTDIDEFSEIREDGSRIIKADRLISSGSTMLNLACSDNSHGAFVKGTVINLIGDKSAGKTMLAWHVIAEALKQGINYEIVYDDIEQALEFDLEYLFGKSVFKKVMFEKSDTIEDVYSLLDELFKLDKPFIYVMDSYDALTSIEERDKDITDGSYRGVPKTRLLSEILRRTKSKIRGSDSLVAIVSQVREDLNPQSRTKTKRTGGKALGHYCAHEIWLRQVGFIKRKDEEVGVETECHVRKNKATGKRKKIEFPIYWDYGIDDLLSMSDWLVEKGVWKKEKGGKTIKTHEFGDLTEGKLIAHIEDNNLEEEVRNAVWREWLRIQDEIKTDRKRRYE